MRPNPDYRYRVTKKDLKKYPGNAFRYLYDPSNFQGTARDFSSQNDRYNWVLMPIEQNVREEHYGDSRHPPLVSDWARNPPFFFGETQVSRPGEFGSDARTSGSVNTQVDASLNAFITEAEFADRAVEIRRQIKNLYNQQIETLIPSLFSQDLRSERIIARPSNGASGATSKKYYIDPATQKVYYEIIWDRIEFQYIQETQPTLSHIPLETVTTIPGTIRLVCEVTAEGHKFEYLETDNPVLYRLSKGEDIGLVDKFRYEQACSDLRKSIERYENNEEEPAKRHLAQAAQRTLAATEAALVNVESWEKEKWVKFTQIIEKTNDAIRNSPTDSLFVHQKLINTVDASKNPDVRGMVSQLRQFADALKFAQAMENPFRLDREDLRGYPELQYLHETLLNDHRVGAGAGANENYNWVVMPRNQDVAVAYGDLARDSVTSALYVDGERIPQEQISGRLTDWIKANLPRVPDFVAGPGRRQRASSGLQPTDQRPEIIHGIQQHFNAEIPALLYKLVHSEVRPGNYENIVPNKIKYYLTGNPKELYCEVVWTDIKLSFFAGRPPGDVTIPGSVHAVLKIEKEGYKLHRLEASNPALLRVIKGEQVVADPEFVAEATSQENYYQATKNLRQTIADHEYGEEPSVQKTLAIQAKDVLAKVQVVEPSAKTVAERGLLTDVLLQTKNTVEKPIESRAAYQTLITEVERSKNSKIRTVAGTMLRVLGTLTSLAGILCICLSPITFGGSLAIGVGLLLAGSIMHDMGTATIKKDPPRKLKKSVSTFFSKIPAPAAETNGGAQNGDHQPVAAAP